MVENTDQEAAQEAMAEAVAEAAQAAVTGLAQLARFVDDSSSVRTLNECRGALAVLRDVVDALRGRLESRYGSVWDAEWASLTARDLPAPWRPRGAAQGEGQAVVQETPSG